jgi:hypothetical protein
MPGLLVVKVTGFDRSLLMEFRCKCRACRFLIPPNFVTIVAVCQKR